MALEPDIESLTRNDLVARGVTIHRSEVDGAEYGLLPPEGPRSASAVVKLNAAGRAVVVGESIASGAERLLNSFLR